MSNTARSGISTMLMFTMAVAVAVMAANLYYAQPLEQSLSVYFHVSSGAIGGVLTTMLIANALGLALLVPLGDIFERKKLLKIMLTGMVGALALMTSAPNIYVFAFAAALTGIAATAVQLVIPSAARLAGPNERGRVVGTVMSGLLIGILLSRTVAGLASAVGGWQLIFGVALIVNGITGYLLLRQLPTMPPQDKSRYRELLFSVIRLIKDEPLLRRRMFYGVAAFIPFSAFWSTVGFLLARPPYGWHDSTIGLFALLGVAGAVVARFAGRIVDHGNPKRITGVYLLGLAISFFLLGLGGGQSDFPHYWRDSDGHGLSGRTCHEPEPYLCHPA